MRGPGALAAVIQSPPHLHAPDNPTRRVQLDFELHVRTRLCAFLLEIEKMSTTQVERLLVGGSMQGDPAADWAGLLPRNRFQRTGGGG